jgi:TonB-linked SusC/RagA family outer membrane protein
MKNKILCFLDESFHLRKSIALFVLLICFFLTSAISFSVSAENKTQNQQTKRTITGIVTDTSGEPLIGVTVREQGTTNGTITNVDGGYSISVANGAILTFNYVGYKPVSQNVTNSVVNAVLTEDIETLDDLVVVGYGMQKKSDVTGAMVSVGQKELKAMPVQNALQAMQGKTAGVDITSNERPGEIGSIRIRGERSLNATNSPLYVVDGIPLLGTGIENLNANDIESIDILKDASATAIYGSRGANGVILVTTKRGKSGSLNLTYDGSVSFQRMYDRVEMMNSGEWIDYSRAARIKAGTYNGSSTISKENDLAVFGTDPYAWAQFEKGWASGSWNGALVPTYDWTSHGLQTALTHEHTVSASGGTDKMQNYLSFGYLKQDGTQPGQQYQRYTAKTSVDITPLQWIKLGTSINASWGDQEYMDIILEKVLQEPVTYTLRFKVCSPGLYLIQMMESISEIPVEM